uniref:Uncharacterized protein n=1 Tax=Tanacetum cinerariifolium TaxID=118510 RepID=A0A699GQE1_TANCI|nr:hypothetical protein [Tanacetum cinerariifolium]
MTWWHVMKKEYIQYPRFTKIVITDVMKKYLSIPKRLEENYHSIKDDIPLVSLYTIGNVNVRGMLILDEFLTEEIYATDYYKEYETLFVREAVPMNQLQLEKEETTTPIPPPGDDRERDEMAEATLLSLTLNKTALVVEAQENIAKVQEKLDKEIEKMVEGEEDKESYASTFADFILNDDEDDGKKDEIFKETDDAKENDNDDQNDHS